MIQAYWSKTCLFGLFLLLPFTVFSQLVIDTVDSKEAVNKIIEGESVYIFNVQFTGGVLSLGQFSDSTSLLGMEDGIMLSSGNVFFAYGPNKSQYTSWVNQQYGDDDLNSIAHGRTYDAAVLEFDFIPSSEKIEFEYLFASEEYTEYVGSKFNDVFGFWINLKGSDVKVNVGTLPNGRTPVTINSINNEENEEYYISNDYLNTTDPILWDTRKRKVIPNKNYGKPPVDAPYFVQFDGFTQVLKAELHVIPGKEYHIKMAIGDVSDAIYDSWVLIKGKSFKSVGTNTVNLEKFKEPQITKLSPLSISDYELADLPLIQPVQLSLVPWVPSREYQVHFPFDVYSIKKTEQEKILQFVDELPNDQEFYLMIVGHTDNYGSENYNIRLSSLRSASVERLLLNHGIKPKQLVKDHFGEYKPISTNSNAEGRALNRRVEIIIFQQF